MLGIPQYTIVWGARYTLGACYISRNTVIRGVKKAGIEVHSIN